MTTDELIEMREAFWRKVEWYDEIRYPFWESEEQKVWLAVWVAVQGCLARWLHGPPSEQQIRLAIGELQVFITQ